MKKLLLFEAFVRESAEDDRNNKPEFKLDRLLDDIKETKKSIKATKHELFNATSKLAAMKAGKKEFKTADGWMLDIRGIDAEKMKHEKELVDKYTASIEKETAAIKELAVEAKALKAEIKNPKAEEPTDNKAEIKELEDEIMDMEDAIGALQDEEDNTEDEDEQQRISDEMLDLSGDLGYLKDKLKELQ